MKPKKDAAIEQEEQARSARLNDRMAKAIRSAVHQGKSQGQVEVEKTAGTCWDAEYGSLETLKLEQARTKADYEALLEKLAAANKEDNNIPSFVQGNPRENENGEPLPRFFHLKPLEKLKVGLFSCLTAGAFGLSYINAQIALASSYNPDFMENPYKTWILASLAPIISSTAKLAPDLFTAPRHKAMAKKGIYLVTILAGLLWVWLFSQNYSGLNNTGGSWSSGNGFLSELSFTWVQLSVEILCGTACFVAASDVLESHHRGCIVVNATKGLTSEYARQLRLQCEKALRDFDTVEQQLTQKTNHRDSFINEQCNAFLIALARFNDLHGNSGEPS